MLATHVSPTGTSWQLAVVPPALAPGVSYMSSSPGAMSSGSSQSNRRTRLDGSEPELHLRADSSPSAEGYDLEVSAPEVHLAPQEPKHLVSSEYHHDGVDELQCVNRA
jgi:hypothetical protein